MNHHGVNVTIKKHLDSYHSFSTCQLVWWYIVSVYSIACTNLSETLVLVTKKVSLAV